jgi:hypothetical protein
MKVARAFGTPGTPQEEVTATPLFPFTSTYSIFAGTCAGNNPGLVSESTPPGAVADALVTPGGSTPATIELPALHLTVWSGADAEDPENIPVEGATVKLSDTKCEEGKPVVRTFTTTAQGGLPDPGLPFSAYDVCVSDGERHVSVPGVEVPFDPEDMRAGTDLAVYLGEPGAETGACP